MENSEISFVTYGRTVIENEWYLGCRVVNRLYFIHGGGGVYIKNGKKFPLEKDRLYFFPATMKVGLENDPQNPVDHTYFDFIMCPVPAAESEVEICIKDNPLIKSAAEDLKNSMSRFKSFSDTDEDGRQTIEESFRAVIAAIDEMRPFKAVEDERINSAILYIHKNYNKNITVQELAQNVYMETNHFIKVLKKHISISPYQYIKDYRFSVAYSMLKSGARVGDAAKQTGFLFVSAFSNAYKKKYGIYPGDVKCAGKYDGNVRK